MKKKLLLLASCMLFLAGCGNEADDYPQSTLTPEPEETVCKEAKDFPSEAGFPTKAYEVAMPESIDSFDTVYRKGTLSYKGNDFSIILYESSEPLASAMNKVGSSGKSTDTTLSYREVIGDTGYINGYDAVYTAGEETFTEDGKEYHSYSVAYDLTIGNDSGAILYVSCAELSNILDAKTLLDEMAYSIHEPDDLLSSESMSGTTIIADTESVTPEDTEEESTETVDSTENPLDGVEFMPVVFSTLDHGTDNVTNEVDNNGYAKTINDHEFEVSGNYEEMYVVFSWQSTGGGQPSGVYLITPGGAKYPKDEELSLPGEYVYIVRSAGPGTYTLHIETYNPLYECSVVYLDKEVYYEMYLNMDADGNPVHGM